jgi:hypothetical protein
MLNTTTLIFGVVALLAYPIGSKVAKLYGLRTWRQYFAHGVCMALAACCIAILIDMAHDRVVAYDEAIASSKVDITNRAEFQHQRRVQWCVSHGWQPECIE